MKKTILFLMTVFVAGNLTAQMIWLSNPDKAKEVANELNKLIVMDFGAGWCAPCRAMDQMVWECSEMDTIAKNFVALKINIDHDRFTPGLYSVSGIPKVVIATSSGFPIWMSTGFNTAEPYLEVLRAIPINAGDLNKNSIAFEKDKTNLKANLNLALSFQIVGKDVKSESLKSKFLERSQYLFGKIQKLSTDIILNQQVELYSVLNTLYLGNSEKALKEINKISSAPANGKIEDLRHFVLAKCFLDTKNQDNFIKEKQLIKSKELRSQLE